MATKKLKRGEQYYNKSGELIEILCSDRNGLGDYIYWYKHTDSRMNEYGMASEEDAQEFRDKKSTAVDVKWDKIPEPYSRLIIVDDTHSYAISSDDSNRWVISKDLIDILADGWRYHRGETVYRNPADAPQRVLEEGDYEYQGETVYDAYRIPYVDLEDEGGMLSGVVVNSITFEDKHDGFYAAAIDITVHKGTPTLKALRVANSFSWEGVHLMLEGDPIFEAENPEEKPCKLTVRCSVINHRGFYAIEESKERLISIMKEQGAIVENM